MRKRLLLFALIGAPCWAQWTVWDPTNYGINLQNLNTSIQAYQSAVAYRQMFQNAAAFLHNPAAFMAATLSVSSATTQILEQGGNRSAAKIQQMQKILAMGQVAMQEAQLASALSSGNASNVGMLAIQMAQVGERLAQEQQLYQFNQRVDYYAAHNSWQPAAKELSNWSLK